MTGFEKIADLIRKSLPSWSPTSQESGKAILKTLDDAISKEKRDDHERQKSS